MTKAEASARPPQADAEFVAECRMPDVPFAAPFALAVRREVARRARVAPEQVWASDRLPEDWAAVVFSRESVSVAALAAELARGAVEGRRPWRWW